MERLLGKSPLRLVAERTQVAKGVWNEKLECGHEVSTYQETLIEFTPTAKRRRCQQCKPYVAPVLKTSAEITAAQTQAEFIHKQKLKFGTLFDVLCFADGKLRPGPNERELTAWCEAQRQLPSPTSPIKKPVQSVRPRKERYGAA